MKVDWESEQRIDHHNPTKHQKNKGGHKLWKETDEENLRQNRSQPKSRSCNIPLELDKQTIPIDPTMRIDKKLLPNPKISLHMQASSNHHIKDSMGCNRPSPPINSEDIKTNWHLFELTTAREELRDQQQPSQPIF